VLDIMMPNKDGFETLREVRQVDRDTPVIMLSGLATPLNVVQAIKSGATDFLAKPVNHEDLGRVLKQVMELKRRQRDTGLEGAPAVHEDMFFGKTPAMRALKSCLPTVAASDVPILIEGETGTGKEVLARQLHALSPRAAKAFVKLNCAAVPSELMESELFGYERGAFTGAFQRKPGVFELADGGTILLDEIGDMDLKLQAKLLQVLQDQEFRRLGGRDVVRVQVRVIAATHRNLLEAVGNNTFREDLYYRLNVFTLSLPPLRERKQDVIGITQYLIDKHSSPEVPPVALTRRLQDALVAFHWPGNIRQLENIVRKLMVLRDPDAIAGEIERIGEAAAAKPKAPVKTEPALVSKADEEPASVFDTVARAKDDAEAEAILAALNRTRWNRKQAAARLNIDYKAFLYKMKKLAIEERARL
jgi:two-component system response regulator AtoC